MERIRCNPNFPPGGAALLAESDHDRIRDVALRRYLDEVLDHILTDADGLRDFMKELLTEACRSKGYRLTGEAESILDELTDKAAEWVAQRRPVEFSRFVI